MNRFARELAPIAAGTWAAIEAESRRSLETLLAARRLVDVVGPLGWEHESVATGRVEELQPGLPEVAVHLRLVQPLLELHAPFRLARRELAAHERGAPDIDLAPLVAAARRIAFAEDRAVFHGFPTAGIRGILAAARHPPGRLAEDDSNLLGLVVDALERLQSEGVVGPYALVLGARGHASLMKASDRGGFPLGSRLRDLLGGAIVRAPAIDGALVLSQRGGDFRLTLGQDLALAYVAHTSAEVELALFESLTFRTLGPEAAVPLGYAAGEGAS